MRLNLLAVCHTSQSVPRLSHEFSAIASREVRTRDIPAGCSRLEQADGVQSVFSTGFRARNSVVTVVDWARLCEIAANGGRKPTDRLVFAPPFGSSFSAWDSCAPLRFRYPPPTPGHPAARLLPWRWPSRRHCLILRPEFAR